MGSRGEPEHGMLGQLRRDGVMEGGTDGWRDMEPLWEWQSGNNKSLL